MDFIAVVKGNYIFTNRLSGIKQNDLVYHYDKKGKKHKEKEIQLPYGEVLGWEWEHEGTGRITQLYKVVGLINPDDLGEYGLLELRGYKYAIKVELIKDIDMELSDFVSWNKWNKSIIQECGTGIDDCNICDYDGECPIQFNTAYNNKLTRYTGLCKVIRLGDE